MLVSMIVFARETSQVNQHRMRTSRRGHLATTCRAETFSYRAEPSPREIVRATCEVNSSLDGVSSIQKP